VQPTGFLLAILDTSEIQARNPHPQVREVSRLTWPRVSIPQNAIPFTEDGHPYVLEFDEYAASALGSGSPDDVGAARIIDIADEAHPGVVANLRLQVNQHAEHHAASGDPGASSPVQGYAAHYCNVPTHVDPKIVACSFIVAGLRLFDISDLVHPKEIGYFVAPTKARRRTASRPATSRCPSRHSCPSATRCGSPTGRAGSTPCASRTTSGRSRPAPGRPARRVPSPTAPSSGAARRGSGCPGGRACARSTRSSTASGCTPSAADAPSACGSTSAASPSPR
jgi:hypothetical protein